MNRVDRALMEPRHCEFNHFSDNAQSWHPSVLLPRHCQKNDRATDATARLRQID
jgi:hypothetical protein